MASTLECIGIPAVSPEQMSDYLMKMAASTRELHRGGDVAHSLWRDFSGAAVGIHLKKGRIECITPWFSSPDGATRWLVESSAPTLDPECLDCSGADVDIYDDDGDMSTRAAIQWLFFRPYRDWLKTKRRYRIETAAFAERVEFFERVEDFDQALQKPEWFGSADRDFRFAENFFLPTGMLGEAREGGMRARARAAFAGRVKSVHARINTVSDLKFLQVRVGTLPGEIDVVHPLAPDLKPRPGMIALVSAWVVGRPADPPPPPRSFLHRLFRRRT